jgi:hypothetical protein
LQLFITVCQAIQHAHQKGILHRDIKPNNVLVCLQDGKPLVKVIDFGIAKALHQRLTDQTLNTEIGQVIGTLEYMSPEQADLSAQDVDTRSDIYALGVLLYELLTGTTPLERSAVDGAPLTEVLRRIKEDEPPRPSTRLGQVNAALPALATKRRTDAGRLCREVRGELDWIAMKCLEKDPERRYETANALARDVERYLADEPVEAGPPSATYRMRKLLRRHKGKVLTAALVALALLAGMVGTTLGLVRAGQAAIEERAARVEAQEARKLADANAADAQAAADRERLARQAATEEERKAKVAAQSEARAAQRALEEQHKAEKIAVKEKQARELAQRRLDQVKKANDILAGIFQDLDAIVEDKDGPSLRVQLLRRLYEVTKQLEGESLGEPLMVARLQHELGTAQQHMSNLGSAQTLLDKALATRLALLGPNHRDTLSTKNVLALLHQTKREFDQAEKYFLDVIQGFTAGNAADEVSALTAKHNLATMYVVAGKHAQAETLFQEVLQARTAKLGPNDLATVTTKHSLALLYKDMGQFSRAELLYLEVLKVRTDQLGADNTATLTAKHNLAALYVVTTRFDLAEPLFLEVIKARTVKLGPDNLDTLTSKHSLAEVYRLQHKFAQAEALYQEALKGRTAQLGPNHLHTLSSQYGLAENHRAAGQLDQAEALFLKVVPGFVLTLGADHPTTLASKNSLAMLYHGRGDYDRAEALYVEVVAKQTAILGADHFHTVSTTYNLAVLYNNQQQYHRAERLFATGLAGARKKLGSAHPVTMRYLQSLSGCYEQLKRWSQAEALRRELLVVVKQKNGPASPAYAAELASLGVNLMAQGRYADAEPVVRECLTIAAALNANPWVSLALQSLLGHCLLGQRRYAHAEWWLLQSWTGLQQLQAQKPSPGVQGSLAETADRLILLYDQWQKPEQAAKWRKELQKVKPSSTQALLPANTTDKHAVPCAARNWRITNGPIVTWEPEQPEVVLPWPPRTSGSPRRAGQACATSG